MREAGQAEERDRHVGTLDETDERHSDHQTGARP